MTPTSSPPQPPRGVSPDELLAARARIPDVKARLYERAEEVQIEAFERLDDWQALNLTRPPRSRRDRGGEWDWLDKTSQAERNRLQRRFYTDNPGFAPDQVADTMRARGLSGSDDQMMDLWLDETRRYEAAGALRRGKLPSARSYSGTLDAEDILPIEDDGYDARVIFGRNDDLEVAAHIAAADHNTLQREARLYLGDKSLDPSHGPAPHRMSFQAWETEVRELEYGLREFPAEMSSNSGARLAELVPSALDDGQDYEDLYAVIVDTAHKAGEEVPGHARIPWR